MEKELLFAQSHEWVRYINESEAYIGLSSYAIKQLGDIVYVNIDAENVDVNDLLGDIESVKAVSDFYSPLKGSISQINEDVIDSPQLINEDPENTWICKITNISDSKKLMKKDEYEKLFEA